MSLASNGTLSLSTINTVLAFTGGNIGVGTTSPSSKLHVNGAIISTGLTTGNLNFTGSLFKNGVLYNNSFQKMGAVTTVLFTSGTSTWSVPSGVNSVQVELVGGSGSGGAGSSAGYSGGGGGAGGYIRAVFDVTAGNTISYSVGSGGTAQTTAGANGNAGVATSITSGGVILTASAGFGGFTGSSGVTGLGGTGGSTTITGITNVFSSNGGEGSCGGAYQSGATYGTGGMGGASYFGGGGSGSGSAAARVGQVYGSGGGGGNNNNTNGAAGAGGVVVITYFAQSSSTDTLNIPGSSSGTVSIVTQSSFGNFNFNLPTSSGSSGATLLSGGGGSTPMTWTNFKLPNFISGTFSASSSVVIPVFSSSSISYVEVKGRFIGSANPVQVTLTGKPNADGTGTTVDKAEENNYVRKNASFTTLTGAGSSGDWLFFDMYSGGDIYNGPDFEALFTIKITSKGSATGVYARQHYTQEAVYNYIYEGPCMFTSTGYFDGSGGDIRSIVLTPGASTTITGTYSVEEYY